MRAGYTVSIVGHAAILGFGLVAFSSPKPLEAEKIDALPIELVSIGEETDLKQGEESSRVLPEEKPQPKPEAEAPIPQPKPEEKPAERPVEAAAPPPPPPPPPPPEPVAEIPEPEPPQESLDDLVASLPEPEPEKPAETAPEPEPAPQEALAPAPRVIVDPNKPRPRPTPPKPVVEKPKPQPTPAPERPQVAEREPQEQFNPDDISALLNKQEPAGGGDPQPAQSPQTIGTQDGRVDAAMTQSEIAALKARLYQCWNPPVAVREAGSLVVMVRINLNLDGSLASSPQVVSVDNVSNPLSQVAAESAIRAVQQCAPFGDILRPETYNLWNQIDFVFDPREMLGVSSG